ncbi:Lsr2 family protein [Oryzobacter terrae]|uniref:histone-like nucleoid-structuring protein Lsr2 n=1 Tax=Oryzobacter terrae TaxID=1620385 RepID=UPI003670EC1C
MARRTVVAYYSDLSGVEIDDKGVGVRFELDGIAYEIDLAEDELDALRAAFAPFVAAARPARTEAQGQSRASVTAPGRDDPTPSAMREWARENGFDVPTRGRVPELVREAYKAANSHRDVATIRRLLTPVSNRR